jgi:hypothetical protein
MTKKLETLFDLPISPSKEVSDAMEIANDIDMHLPSVPEDALDKELDELADKAVESFENLQSLGMNVEARFSAPIFDAASKMLGHAVTAKLGKAQKKLKQQEIALRAQKQAQQMADEKGEAPINVEVKVWDRNELLNSFRKQ